MAERNDEGEVRAAGGLVLRGGPGRLEVLLVHRPAFDDWTLPKGKSHAGETDREAAVREVLEETGLRCQPGEEIGRIHYLDRKGRPKVARYWAMRPIDGGFAATKEVDQCRWVDLADSATVATRTGEQEFLTAIARRLHGAADEAAASRAGPYTIVREKPDPALSPRRDG